MSYKLVFKEEALKEWRTLDDSIREQVKKKLEERLLENPRVESARLSGMGYCYKLKSAGYRLVYQVRDETVTVVAIAVGKRERNLVYKIAVKRV